MESSYFSPDCKHFSFSSQKDVDAALLLWFKQARSNNTPINGPLLLMKATSLARLLGHEPFTATTGFINRRHGILIKSVSGEGGSVSEEDIRPWLDVTLSELVSQYKPEDSYNVDKTEVFYKLQPD